MRKNNLPIGIFDSGIGGLTVVKEIVRELPNESIIYLGDTARIPYGTRSKEVIVKFSLELVNFLLTKNVKALVVACNTISANALEEIKKISPVPVVDVISATKKIVTGRAGVIATAGTISSGAYASVAKFSQACPLFVPFAEEGITSGTAIEEIARGYLSGLKKAKIDTLILGCTHYPLLRSVIAKTMGNKVQLIESGEPTAKKLREILQKSGLLQTKLKPHFEFYFTDNPERVVKTAEKFFGQKLPGKIIKIEL
ncbi:glutamate racemase [Candidatus Gottesmanbacteria bacterium]|nr:glutamate racemase [Candidatus Gottesmanbacteria bacterium]